MRMRRETPAIGGTYPRSVDTFTFVASLAGSVAGPITIAVLAFLFRKEIRALTDRLKRVKAGPLEVELQEAGAKRSVAKSQKMGGSQEPNRLRSSSRTRSHKRPVTKESQDGAHPEDHARSGRA